MEQPKKAQPGTLPPHLTEVVDTLPKELRTLVRALPQRLMDVAALAPVFVDRKVGATLLTRNAIPVSHRSLEAWPLPWQRANGRALTPSIAMLALAHEKMVRAPVVMGGRQTATTPDAP